MTEPQHDDLVETRIGWFRTAWCFVFGHSWHDVSPYRANAFTLCAYACGRCGSEMRYNTDGKRAS